MNIPLSSASTDAGQGATYTGTLFKFSVLELDEVPLLEIFEASALHPHGLFLGDFNDEILREL
jgi:hypothetical protein